MSYGAPPTRQPSWNPPPPHQPDDNAVCLYCAAFITMSDDWEWVDVDGNTTCSKQYPPHLPARMAGHR